MPIPVTIREMIDAVAVSQGRGNMSTPGRAPAVTPVEVLHEAARLQGGHVTLPPIDRLRDHFMALAPAQRVFVLQQIAKGQPVVVTVRPPQDPASVAMDPLPQQIAFLPVQLQPDRRWSEPGTFLRAKNPFPWVE